MGRRWGEGVSGTGAYCNDLDCFDALVCELKEMSCRGTADNDGDFPS